MLSVDTHNHLKKYGKGISLLLVDDDVISLELYRNLLSEYFPSVDIATDGIEAFEKWSKKSFGNRCFNRFWFSIENNQCLFRGEL